MDHSASVESHKDRPKVGNVQENIVTQSDLQLKHLVQKQMSTDITLQGYVLLYFTF